MGTPKTETLTVRLAPEIKDSLRKAAAQEHRSLANMLEVMIRDWCGRQLGSPGSDSGPGAREHGSSVPGELMFGHAQEDG